MKLHRLGRTSFRAVKSKRDCLRHRSFFNWLYLSRLAALKEFAFMKALDEHGFPVPSAVDCNRHCMVMSLVHGYPLVQVKQLQNPYIVFETILGLVIRLVEHGLIHCDFNEFNIMVPDNLNREPSLGSVLSDHLFGAFLEDAMFVSCGHSFGGLMLRRVIEASKCTLCNTEIESGSLIPNYALRAAAIAVKQEDEGDLFIMQLSGNAGRKEMSTGKMVMFPKKTGHIECAISFFNKRAGCYQGK